jgi:hypothetical protein
MANIPGRFIQGGLGNLPDYSGNGPLPPIGVPPPVGQISPGSTGQPVTAVSDKQSFWQSQPFVVGTTPLQLQGFLLRKFLLLQSLDAALTLYFGFGWIPNATNGLTLGPGVGYEPFAYPVNEIWVVASGAGAAGLIITGV